MLSSLRRFLNEFNDRFTSETRDCTSGSNYGTLFHQPVDRIHYILTLFSHRDFEWLSILISYVCMKVCMYVLVRFVWSCMFAYGHLHLLTCICICMYVCVCLAVRRSRRQLTLGEAERVVRRALQVDAARQTGALTLVHTCIHTYIHTYIHTLRLFLPGWVASEGAAEALWRHSPPPSREPRQHHHGGARRDHPTGRGRQHLRKVTHTHTPWPCRDSHSYIHTYIHTQWTIFRLRL